MWAWRPRSLIASSSFLSSEMMRGERLLTAVSV
jgi:hypothetical protein